MSNVGVPNRCFDVAVIGAGVVGCAVARRFALQGAGTVVLEQGADILSGASKANSAILHTGFDAAPDTLEQACLASGYREFLEIHKRFNLPMVNTGAIVVAWTGEEAARLDAIVRNAHANGVRDTRLLSRAELVEREPDLSRAARAGVLVPGENIIDPWSTPLAYLLQAMAHDAVVLRDTRVESGAFDGQVWSLDTTRGRIRARTVVNCAGLYGDVVEERVFGRSAFAIRPRKGQFVVLDKAASRIVRSIILPVPGDKTKGVLITRTVFGNVLVGPTAEDQDDRARASVDRAVLQGLLRRAIEIMPALRDVPVVTAYAGLRPATERKDYQIAARNEQRWVSVGGIRSTGLSAALGIANYVLELTASASSSSARVVDPIWPRVSNLAEHRPRDWNEPGYGEIVCHCELVTDREIARALSGPLPAADLGGLKRRTRAGMGPCQSFHCGARLADLTRENFEPPLAMALPHER